MKEKNKKAALGVIFCLYNRNFYPINRYFLTLFRGEMVALHTK